MSSPLAALANYKGRGRSITSPVLCGTRLAFEWNKGALDSLVDAFIEFNPQEPEPPDREERRPLPKNHHHQPVLGTNQNDKSWDREPNKDPVYQTRDFLAFYAQASTNSSERYGIHFRVGRICKLALELSRELHKGNAEAAIDKEVLEALIVMIFWHEVGHGWIEDIASMIDPSRYRDTQTEYGGYIFMEEAICNTIALRMLRFYRREQAATASPLIKAFKAFMRSQGPGYEDFIDLGPWSEKQLHLEGHIVRLLVRVYGYDPAAAENETTKFFAHHTPVPWMTHRRHPKDHIPPYMSHWRHPLHAEKIPGAKHTGKKLGQPLTPLLAAVLDDANATNINKIIKEDVLAINAWDFIGPAAAVRILAQRDKPVDLLKGLELADLKRLKQVAGQADCYGRKNADYEKLLNSRLVVGILARDRKSLELES